jgi:hypothetical protein
MRKKTMSSWRVWIGSPRVGLLEWRSHVVTAKDNKEAVREAYRKITGIRGLPSRSWIAWNVRNVEFIGRS